MSPRAAGGATPAPDLAAAIRRELSRRVTPAIGAAAAKIEADLGGAVLAVIYYGSCLRKGDHKDGIVDFYTIVERYRDVYTKPLPALLNALLPPNVYYVEVPASDGVVRVKYAVMSLADFTRAASRRSFHSSIWARFAQPCALVRTRDAEARRQMTGALASAVETLIVRTLPLMPPTFTSRDLWSRAFSETYRAELRAERPGQVADLYAADAGRYDRMTRAVLSNPAHGVSPAGAKNAYRARLSGPTRWSARTAWWARRWAGKVLVVLRLAKATLTFTGGVDYILWKIERHSGVRVPVTPWQKRHPILAAPVIMTRLYRRGAFR